MATEHCQKFLLFIALIAFAILGSTITLAADAPHPVPLPIGQIVARMAAMDAQRTAKKQSYRGLRHYTVDYKGFPHDKHAEMVVQVTVNPPRKELTIVSETGSKFLLNRVLRKIVDSERETDSGRNHRDVSLTEENYNFQLVGTEPVQGRLCYVLQVDPKHGNKFLYRGKVWIDAEDFALTQISAKPAKNPSFWISSVNIEHHYQKHGDLWLPSSSESTSKVRLGGKAMLTIDYKNYDFPENAVADTMSRQNP